MSRTSNPTAQHYILTHVTGATIATDKIGANAGFAAYARMIARMAKAAGTDRLRPLPDSDGRRFWGGFVLEGPFQTL